MAVEPDIAMGFQPPNLGQFNVLDNMQKAVGIGGQMQQNYITGQSIQARQAFGKLIATAPDIDSAIKAGMSNPQIAAFAPEMLQNLASLQQTQTATKGLVQSQSHDGLDNFMSNIGVIAQDPSHFDDLKKMALAGMPDGPAKDSTGKAIDAMKSGLTANYDPKDPASIKNYQQMIAGFAVNHGMRAGEAQVGGGATQQGVYVGTVFVPTAGGSSAGGAGTMQNPQENGAGVGGAPGGDQSADSSGIGRSMTLEQSKMIEGTANQALDTQKEYNERVAALPNAVQRLKAVANTLTKFQAGAGAPVRMAAQQAIQSLQDFGLPIPKELQDRFGKDDLRNGQLFQQEIGNFAVQALQQVQSGLGRASAMELNNAIGQYNTDKDPLMLYNALKVADTGLRISEDETNAFHQYQDTLGPNPKASDLIRFPAVFNKMLAAHNYEPETPSHLPPEDTIRSSDPNAPINQKGKGAAAEGGRDIGKAYIMPGDTSHKYIYLGGPIDKAESYRKE